MRVHVRPKLQLPPTAEELEDNVTYTQMVALRWGSSVGRRTTSLLIYAGGRRIDIVGDVEHVAGKETGDEASGPDGKVAEIQPCKPEHAMHL
jgi:hypothetical protein